MTWYVFLARVDENNTFLFVVDPEQITHTAVLSNEDATALHKQLERGDNSSFWFIDDVGAGVTLPLDYVTPVFYTESTQMKKFIKRLATPQTRYNSV